MLFLKTIRKKILPPIVLDFLAFTKNKVAIMRGKSAYSFLDEEVIIKKYLNELSIKNKYCVDIAASNGITMSNTYSLFKEGWDGMAVEFDSILFGELSNHYEKFSNVNLVKTKVIPDNVISILKSCLCPKEFAFLSFDIDSYDHYVLDELLSEYRPQLVCVEINEKIPPPISFTVKYSSDHVWAVDHFYGQSISMCYKLCIKYNYDIVELHYNNLFMVPKEVNKFNSLTPEEAYDVGYRNKKDRKEKFPWNKDMEELLVMDKENGIKFLAMKFEKYSGKFILE